MTNAQNNGKKIITTDVLIIGAGPVGLFAVFELGLHGLQCHVVDILDKVGGQCAELYPDKPIYDIPALPVVSGQELTNALLKQIEPFQPIFHLGQMAETLEQKGERWLVQTDAGVVFDVKCVVIAAGGGSFQPKKPAIPNIEEFEDTKTKKLGVAYAVRDLNQYQGQDILIAGGGDSALDWALNLVTRVKTLHLLHRRREFRGAAASVEKLEQLIQQGKIQFHLGNPVELSGDEHGRLRGVVIAEAGVKKQLAVTAFLAFYGLSMKLGPLANWGLSLGLGAMDKNLILVDTAEFRTNLVGVYAIGDINYYPGKLKLILSGFHEAALMAIAVKKQLAPSERVTMQYTTSSTKLQKLLKVI